MKTGDMFICKVCGLPIRNPKKAKPGDSECFICETCDVCALVHQSEMQNLKDDLLDQLSWVIENLYRHTHAGKSPPLGFMDAVRARLGKEPNPADDAIESITQLLNKPESSYETLLRQ